MLVMCVCVLPAPKPLTKSWQPLAPHSASRQGGAVGEGIRRAAVLQNATYRCTRLLHIICI